jgi:hypothetical protein
MPTGRWLRSVPMLITLITSLGLVCFTGCGDTSLPSSDARPLSNITLTLRCADGAFIEAIRPAASSWANRTGAVLQIKTESMRPGDDTDIGILPSPQFGAWADRGDLVPVPATLRTADNPFQWTALLPAYREQLIEWGGQARAIPLAGDGYIIVHRTDRLTDPAFSDAFKKRFGRSPLPVTSLEDFADVAAFASEHQGRPALPHFSDAELAELFFRVAACYDRLAQTDSGGEGVRQAGSLEGMSFQFDLKTGKPRLKSPGFSAAEAWLDGMVKRKCFPATSPAADPVKDLVDGPAVIAVFSLARLAQLPREKGGVPARFGIAPLPGSSKYTDPIKHQLTATKTPNYVPYFGGGRLGVVRTRCPSPDAAFDLLAYLGGPVRSQEVIATPGLGAGPFRVTHLDRDRLQIWLGYGFDPERSKLLQDAMRLYIRPDVRNPAHALRGPDQEPLERAAAETFGKLLADPAAKDVLGSLEAKWNSIDDRVLLETRLRWRKMAAGLQ